MKELAFLFRLEYGKLMKRRLTWFAILGILFLVIADPTASLVGTRYYDGTPIGSSAQWRIWEREVVDAMEGMVIDEAFLKRAEQSVRAFWDEAEEIRGTEGATERYVSGYMEMEMPYNILLESISGLGIRRYEMDFTEYYAQYDAYIRDYYKSGLSEKAISELVAMSRKNQPFVYGWQKGCNMYAETRNGLSFYTCFALVICLSGMFAGEVSSRMEAVVLSTRYGKNKLLAAKLLVGMSLALVVSVVTSLISYVANGMVYGFGGTELAAQMMHPFIAWNLTMGQLCLIMTGCGVLAAMLTAAVTMALSAQAKSSSSVLIIGFLFLLIPLFINIPGQYRIPAAVYHLLPSLLPNIQYAFDGSLVLQIGDSFLPEWQSAYPVYLAASTILTVLTYRTFQKHQVGR